MKRSTRGFTLIEVLVVVLIIIILAAVALPQYQKTVLKSRFTQTKILVKTLAEAEEVYYLANDSYTKDWGALDIDLSSAISCTNEEEDHSYCYFSWGFCRISQGKTWVECDISHNGGPILGYKLMFNQLDDAAAGQAQCFARNASTTEDIQIKICQSETGKQDNDWGNLTAGIGWNYR